MVADLDIPFEAFETLAQLDQTHTIVETIPDGDESRAYALAIPSAWAYAKKFGPVTDALLVPRGIGYFSSGVEADDPVVSVTATRVPFEVPIDHWTRASFIGEGWTVVRGVWFPGPHGSMFDLVGTRIVGDIELVRRTTVRNDGITLFSVSTVCSRKVWNTYKKILWVSHLTFRLTRGQNERRMEPWLGAVAATPSFRIAYPQSWESELAPSHQGEISGVHLRLLDAQQQTLMAYVLVRAKRLDAIPQRSLRALIKATTVLLERSEIRPVGQLLPPSDTEDPRAVAIEGWLGGVIGDGTLGTAEITLRLGFLERKGLLFTLVLCGPKREQDPLTAFRATRAFEIARLTIEVLT